MFIIFWPQVGHDIHKIAIPADAIGNSTDNTAAMEDKKTEVTPFISVSLDSLLLSMCKTPLNSVFIITPNLNYLKLVICMTFCLCQT